MWEKEPWYRPEFGKLRQHKSGHLIIKKGRFRDVSVHRALVTLLLEEKPSPIYGDTIPEGFVIHHQDFQPAHNCPHNFIMMELAFHTYCHKLPLIGRWIRLRKKSLKLLPPPAALDNQSRV